MLKKIKTLVKLKEEINDSIENIDNSADENNRKRTYHETGHRESTRNHGGRIALSVSLKSIYAKFQNEEKQNTSKQQKLNEPFLAEKGEKETEIKTKTVVIENLIDKKAARIKKIEDLKLELADLPNNPHKYGINAEKGASVKFWIGIIILLPITLYLMTFYISTSYSAFFKNFTIGDGVIESILDANAFAKAWQDGPLEGMFVTFIPFVFLGLGYLVHMFSEKKSFVNGFKIFALILVTFVFDAILAYLIESKLYELSKTINSPDFNLSFAFQEVSFWGIIFAGFIVYIIWGLVFDFIMKEHKEKDKITSALKQRNQKIIIEKEEVDSIDSKLHLLKEDIEKLKGRIDELNRLINSVIIPVKDYQLYASEYMQGWITSISETLHGARDKKEKLISECNEEYLMHIEKMGSDSEYQNKIFLSQN